MCLVEVGTIGYFFVALKGFGLQHYGVDLAVLQVALLGRSLFPPFARCEGLGLVKGNCPASWHLHVMGHGLLL